MSHTTTIITQDRQNVSAEFSTSGALDADACALLAHTQRGGTWPYYWTDDGKRSFWFSSNTLPPTPLDWSGNIYFGVHPSTTNRGENRRSTVDTVAAINCLFAEFDAKDEVKEVEYTSYLPTNFAELSAIDQKKAINEMQERVYLAHTQEYKRRAFARIEQLPLFPTVVIDSGGGFHCYWFLEHTLIVTDANRARMRALQAAWVELVGADPASKDLARVLRVPGTYNMKDIYAPNQPKVDVFEVKWDRLYNITRFEQLTGIDEAWAAGKKAAEATRQRDNGKPCDSVIAEFNRTHHIVDLLIADGYTLGWERSTMARLARPGREKHQTSVVVFKDDDKELSYHHSSNDALRSTHCHDAFSIFTQLKHDGNVDAAHEAAKRDQGKWREKSTKPTTLPQFVVGDTEPEPDNTPDEPHPLAIELVKNLALGWIDQYADLMTTLTGSPREFNQASGLVTASTAIQRRARLRMSFGDIYPNVYVSIIAPSSVYHKSSAISKPRMLFQRAMMEKLLLPELATSEGLLNHLAGQSSGVILRDEIGTLFSSHNTKYLATLKPDLTALYDCYPYSRRLSNHEFKVEKPYLNILGATTPTRFYEGVTQTDWADGFLARWLFVLPEGEPNFDATTGLFSHADEVTRLSNKLLELDRQQDTDFVFSGDAHRIWDTWQRQSAKNAYVYGDDIAAAIVTRYSAYALKFSLILAAVNDSWGTITPDIMQTAIHLADSYKHNVRRLLSEKANYGISGGKLQKVLKILQRRQNLTAREIGQIANMRATEVAPCLEKLTEVGAIMTESAGKATRYITTGQELPIKVWK